MLGTDAVAWARNLIHSGARTGQATRQATGQGIRQGTGQTIGRTLVGADEVAPARVDQLAAAVVASVGDKRSTWQRWNLFADASRQLMGVRFATALDREAALERVTAAAEALSVR